MGQLFVVIFVVYTVGYIAYYGITQYAGELILFAIIAGLIWYAIHMYKKAKLEEEKQEQARLQEEEKQEQARLQELAQQKSHEQKQDSYRKELIEVGTRSIEAFESLPKNFSKAEKLLDQAEKDFGENAFAPFWDSVEQATIHLGNFDSNIKQIERNLQKHCELTDLYEFEVQQFPIFVNSVDGMAAGNITAERMKVIVRKAQCNFKFASIYENRKTNQILVSGFTNLAQALNGMGQRIASSIDELNTQVFMLSSNMQISFDALGQQIQNGTYEIVESIDSLHNVVSDKMESLEMLGDLRERHDKSLEMLDDIRHRRRPVRDPIYDLNKERY